jgi:glycerate kinase
VKIIIAPDKFKGSLTSLQACDAISRGLVHANHEINILSFPMADGGDGFSTVLKSYLNTISIDLPSVDALGRAIRSSYEWDATPQTAIIEVASCSGLAMLKESEKNPFSASTHGTGLQIKHAIENGASKILLGLGGSATNDGGTGILGALGFSFFDKNGLTVLPSGEALLRIDRIRPPVALPQVQFEIATDVINPMYGSNGAAFIFSPQKGATPQDVELLDKGLEQFAKILKLETGKDVANIPGTGAAGGIAASLLSYFPTNIVKGISIIMQASGIETAIRGADLVITGEGKLDPQSFHGKTVGSIASMANAHSVPCICLCGKLELTPYEIKQMGLEAALSISEGLSLEESTSRAAQLLEKIAGSLFSYLPGLDKA